MKKQIKLTESEFKALIKESVSKILKEHDLIPGGNSESVSMENNQNRDYFSMPVIIVGGKLNGEYTINDVINNFEVTGYVERYRNSAYKNSKIVGYPMIKGYHGPMWDGDRIRYESPEVYHSLSI
jgi:hypothetical protein